MRQRSMRSIIRIQKLQNKNRMVGQTFNPSGITSEQIANRERDYVADLKAKGVKAIEEQRKYFIDSDRIREENGWHHSQSWEYCAFERAFGINSVKYWNYPKINVMERFKKVPKRKYYDALNDCIPVRFVNMRGRNGFFIGGATEAGHGFYVSVSDDKGTRYYCAPRSIAESDEVLKQQMSDLI